MLLRCIMTVLLLIATAMPVWANTSNVSPSASITEQSAIKNALSKITVEAKDSLDGNTYQIRYTFTNPTDVQIDKSISYMTAKYESFYPASVYSTPVVQYSDSLPRLTIPPHSAYTITVSLPQQNPAVFNDLTGSSFYFDDHSYLDYAKALFDAPKALFSLSPIVSDDGKAYFSVQNDSISKTITEISNIRLYFYHDGQCTISLLADPITLNVKPNESQVLDFFPAKALTAKAGSPSEPFYPYSKPFYEMRMKINGISHTYSETSSQYDFATKDTTAYPFKTKYETPSTIYLSQKGSFCLDDAFLYAYIPLTNTNDKPISAPFSKYTLILDYFDQNTLLQTALFDIHLPQNLTMSPHETKHFSFKIRLPSDFHHDIPIIYHPHFIARHPDMPHVTLLPIEEFPLSVPKEDHTVITHVKVQKPNDFARSFRNTII